MSQSSKQSIWQLMILQALGNPSMFSVITIHSIIAVLKNINILLNNAPRQLTKKVTGL
jgi:hypothetical protein